MKNVIMLLFMIVATSAQALTDGTYIASEVYCSGQELSPQTQEKIAETLYEGVHVLKVKGTKIITIDVDECATEKVVYEVKNKKKSTRLHYIKNDFSYLSNPKCGDMQRMQTNYDFLIINKTENKLEISPDIELDQDSECQEKIVLTYEKVK